MYSLLKEEIYINNSPEIQQIKTFDKLVSKFFGYDLPNEIHVEIFKFLNPRELNNCLLVHRQFNVFISSNSRIIYDPIDLKIKELFLILREEERIMVTMEEEWRELDGELENKKDELDSRLNDCPCILISCYSPLAKLFGIDIEKMLSKELDIEIEKLDYKIKVFSITHKQHELKALSINNEAAKFFKSKLGDNYSSMDKFPYSSSFLKKSWDYGFKLM